MKFLMKIILVMGIICLFRGEEAAAERSLQSQINRIPEGGTLRLKEGIYNEAIVLKKPIVIEGEKGVVFRVCSRKPAISITGKKVTLKRIKIVGCKKQLGQAAIYVTGNHHRLEDLTIHYGKAGLTLENVKNTSFRNIKISGAGKENGCNLWDSYHNTFTNIQMDHVQDGFYMENSHYNKFEKNVIYDSRYGLHVMFSNHITIKRNKLKRNFTGAMMMGTSQSVIEGNQLMDNNQNVNAQGLLLYHVYQSTIKDNRISGNRVGMFMEESNSNEIKNNVFSTNFIGAQINNIKKNVIEGNSFIRNVNEFQANGGHGNRIQFNYWDAAINLETDGDGKSNLPYKADPYFLNLVKETPSYRLFFQHPGLVLLKKMLKSPEDLLVTDEKPLMNLKEKNIRKEPHMAAAWLISLFMIFGSLLIIHCGRKKV